MTPADMLAHWPDAAGLETRPLPGGHVNRTFTVGDDRFVLQCINGRVFTNPEGVMRNLAKLAERHAGVVAPIPARSGASWVTDDAGELWRLFPFVDARNFQDLPDTLVEPAGFAFGAFHAAVADFDDDLEPVIEGFHELPGYLDALWQAAPAPSAELDYVRGREGFEFPRTRTVIHGDCKVNNLLFHPTESRVTHLIDLDTAMYGHPAWDFGDLVRSVASGSEEASSLPSMSVETFERVAHGFARGAGGIADPRAFAAAPGHMSFMLGVRFLADHCSGDRYFRVARRGQNLERARSQLAAARRFDVLEAAFEDVLRHVAAMPLV